MLKGQVVSWPKDRLVSVFCVGVPVGTPRPTKADYERYAKIGVERKAVNHIMGCINQQRSDLPPAERRAALRYIADETLKSRLAELAAC